MSDNSSNQRGPERKGKGGYKDPPKHSQFQKGRSGNARGRPPESRNFATLVKAALEERVSATENGRRRKISRRELIARQLVNRSVGNDLKAITMLLGIMQQIEATPSASRVHTRNDEEVLKGIRERFLGPEDDDEAA